jgi:hypothetical protein
MVRYLGLVTLDVLCCVSEVCRCIGPPSRTGIAANDQCSNPSFEESKFCVVATIQPLNFGLECLEDGGGRRARAAKGRA